MPRFSDSRGQSVPLARLPNILRSLGQVFERRFLGIYPELPWIPFAAIPQLERILTPQSLVWEVGSGMSTIWLSQRAKKIVSIEADKVWHDKLQSIIASRKITNVDLRFEWIADHMTAFTDVEDCTLDLLFVDGGPRTECLINGLKKVKSGGYIYLDNWDVADFWQGAEDFLHEHRLELSVPESIVDYVPGNFAVNEGLLLRKL